MRRSAESKIGSSIIAETPAEPGREAASFLGFPHAAWLFVIWAALFFVGVAGYPNLLDNEKRIAAYALDVLQNGNWVVQHDTTGDFMSKPPALTWLVAVFSLCTGGLSMFSLYLPSALATLGVALLIYRAGREHFSERAGWMGALMYLLSYVTDKQLTTARYDGLFAFPVLLGALAAYRGWREGRGWFVFWVAMAIGGMVKGPLVFLLGGLGLLACLWEREAGCLFRWRWQHAAGIGFFVLVCGGWLALVLSGHREEFMDKMIRRELVAQAVNDSGKLPLERFWEAPVTVVIHFLPWTPLAIWGLVKALRGRRQGDGRTFERYLACWFLAGLAVFCIAAHQRGRLMWPLIPALAIFAGHVLDGWLKKVSSQVVYRWAAGLSIAVVVAFGLIHLVFLRYSVKCQQTLAMRDLARTLRNSFGERPPVMYVDAPFAVQFYLNQFQYNTEAAEAAAKLNSTNSAFVLTSERSADGVLRSTTNKVFTLYTWPAKGKPAVKLLSNRPELAVR